MVLFVNLREYRTDSRIMQKYIVYFDGVCNLCNSAVDFVIKHKANDIYFCSLQSKRGQEVLNKSAKIKNLETIIFEKDEQLFTHSDAAIEIAKLLKKPYNYLQYSRFLPRFIRDFIYKLVSHNRYRLFGKKSTCRIPTEEERKFFIE